MTELTGTLHLLRWTCLRMRRLLPLLVALQVVLGVGVIYGFSFLVPHITPATALFLATGAPTLSLLVIGITVVSQETAQARTNGRFGYVAALPVGRLAPMAADVVFWLLVQLPGTLVTLLLARFKFDVALHVSPLLVPAMLLTSLTAAAVGYAIAVSMPPTAANQVASFVSIGLLLFSPITFPLHRLPVVLQDVHRGLPITYMADIVRGGLTGSYGASRSVAYGVVTAYCIAGLTLSARAARRRA